MALRVKNLPTKADAPSRQKVADFFGLDIKAVGVEKQQETFSIDISENVDAQTKFKTIAPYGNSSKRPGAYDFSGRILVMWNGTKVQPV